MGISEDLEPFAALFSSSIIQALFIFPEILFSYIIDMVN